PTSHITSLFFFSHTSVHTPHLHSFPTRRSSDLSGSTDLILGAFHRGMITGDNAWQYFSQIRWQQPFLYQSAYNPDSGLNELYKRSEEHTSELQSLAYLVCRLLLEKKKKKK